MLRDMAVRDLMVTDVVTFSPDLNVQDAMRQLVEQDIDAGPVVDEHRKVIGMFSTGDVIVEEARLHFPTIVNFLGVNVALPWHDKELDESVAKALGEFVRDVMTAKVLTIKADATIEDAATLMHDEQVSRLPVVDTTNRLIGLLSRGDIVRAIVLGLDEPTEEEVAAEDAAEAAEEDEFTEMLEARAEADREASGGAAGDAE
jgi:CBS domain-containing protein